MWHRQRKIEASIRGALCWKFIGSQPGIRVYVRASPWKSEGVQRTEREWGMLNLSTNESANGGWLPGWSIVFLIKRSCVRNKKVRTNDFHSAILCRCARKGGEVIVPFDVWSMKGFLRLADKSTHYSITLIILRNVKLAPKCQIRNIRWSCLLVF